MRILIPPIKALVASALIVFAVGCSEFNAPTASVTTDETISQNYPPLENVLTAVEAAGYRVVSPIAQNALDDCDSVIVDRYARVNQGGSLNLQGLVRLEWAPGVIPENLTLSIVAPADCIGAADFYPHPTFFNGNVSIVWDVNALDLPDDFDYNSLVPLYVHDDGTIEEVTYSWRGGYNQLVVETNHFSRYIITSRIGS